ncbi:cation-translocating P-type ATPase C-terminal domain-containing protein, partial [Microbacteriaceae bacterium K1510]|nr:cation-translocating P-type ATPase C-terminal domain-containing protein [Microbacteriaceae bacterium K1510]
LSVLSSLLLLLGVIYIDQLQPIFKTVELSLRDWALVFVAGGVPTFVAGIGGALRRYPTSVAQHFRQILRQR